MPSTTTDTKPVTAELDPDGEYVEVRFDYDPQLVKLVKKVPSARFRDKTKPRGPYWRLNLDLVTMRKLREQFGADLALGSNLRQWGQAQVEREEGLAKLSDANDGKLKHVKGKLAKWLRPYQRADAIFMAETNVLNCNQPRTGKTPTTVTAILEAGLEWGQHLVFAPKTSLSNVWADGIRQAYEMAGLDEPTILTGNTPKERTAALKEAAQLAEDGYAFWLVVNPAMGRLVSKVVGKGDQAERVEELKHPEFLAVEWDSMIIDEFHLMGLSNPQTQGAKGMLAIAEATQPTKRFALSGTPMGGKPIKLWGALHFLNPEEFTSRWNWARHWLVINTNGYGSTIEGIMPGREVAFYEHLKPYLVRRTQREALPGLPPVNRVNVWCDMTPNQAEQYQTMLNEAEWALEDAEQEGRLTATNVLAMYTRLKQFANAYCTVAKTGKDDALGVPKLDVRPTQDSGKLEQLLERLEECNVITTSKDDDEPACALVFSQFNAMVEMVAKALEERGVPTAVLTGKTTDKQRDAIVRAFQAGGPDAPRVLVMNTMAGGSAITCDRAETVHLLDETWVPDNQEQAENRVTPTTAELMEERVSTGAYYYRTRGSVEEYIRKLVADKALNNKTILDLRRRMQQELAAAESDSE